MAQPTHIIELQEIIKILAQGLRKQDFLTYFTKISYISKKKDVLTLGVVSEFLRDNIAHRFEGKLLEACKHILKDVEKIEIIVDTDIDNPSYESVVDCQEVFKQAKAKPKKVIKDQSLTEVRASKVTDRYTLGNFIVGSSNQLAHAACEAIVRKPGAAYNPLFIYSDVGLGKTHLMQATANALKLKSPSKKIVYTTADRFISDYVTSVKNRTVDRMRQKYQSIDALIIDDVQFLAGKKQTQEEIYKIFNMMYESGRQVIFSSDRPPRELSEIEPRLLSRFEWGIMVDIDVPDFETKLAILQQKSREREFIIPQDVAEYIAYNLGKNIREIEGILNQMIAEYELHQTPPTIENISKRLDKLAIQNDMIGTTHNKEKFQAHSYKDILKAVSDHFGISLEVMLGDSRSQDVMIPRQVCMYLLKNKMRFTYERIGNIFNGRQHSAVMYACRKLEEVIKKDQRLYYEINVIRDKLGL